MQPSTIRTLAFVALSLLVLTASCGTFIAMEPYNNGPVSFDK